jgi:hypothetical protein
VDEPRAVDESGSPMWGYTHVHVSVMGQCAQPTTAEEDKVSIPEADTVSCEAGWGFEMSIDSHNHLPCNPTNGTLYRLRLMKIHAWMHTT